MTDRNKHQTVIIIYFNISCTHDSYSEWNMAPLKHIVKSDCRGFGVKINTEQSADMSEGGWGTTLWHFCMGWGVGEAVWIKREKEGSEERRSSGHFAEFLVKRGESECGDIWCGFGVYPSFELHAGLYFSQATQLCKQHRSSWWFKAHSQSCKEHEVGRRDLWLSFWVWK